MACLEVHGYLESRFWRKVALVDACEGLFQGTASPALKYPRTMGCYGMCGNSAARVTVYHFVVGVQGSPSTETLQLNP